MQIKSVRLQVIAVAHFCIIKVACVRLQVIAVAYMLQCTLLKVFILLIVNCRAFQYEVFR